MQTRDAAIVPLSGLSVLLGYRRHGTLQLALGPPADRAQTLRGCGIRGSTRDRSCASRWPRSPGEIMQGRGKYRARTYQMLGETPAAKGRRITTWGSGEGRGEREGGGSMAYVVRVTSIPVVQHSENRKAGAFQVSKHSLHNTCVPETTEDT